MDAADMGNEGEAHTDACPAPQTLMRIFDREARIFSENPLIFQIRNAERHRSIKKTASFIHKHPGFPAAQAAPAGKVHHRPTARPHQAHGPLKHGPVQPSHALVC